MSAESITKPGLITVRDSALSGSTNLVATGLAAIGQAQEYANTLATSAGELFNINITPVFPSGPDAPGLVSAAGPTQREAIWELPPTPGSFIGELDVSDLFFEKFDEDAPLLTFVDAPEFESEELPGAPEVDTSYELPELSVTLPARPDFLSISISPFGGMNLPTFDAEAPEFALVAPDVREYTPGAFYTSALLTRLQATLQERLAGGGTGLGAEAEQALWERGREREARSQADAISQLEEMESLGFMFPPGVYLDARIKIITETDYAARGHSREVMIESARLEAQNVQNALTTAVQLEDRLMTYTNSVEQRLFDSARYATEAGVSIYNAGVQAFAARVTAYTATAGVYEARIRAEVAKVDAYRAQVAAEQAKADVNRALVDRYQAEIAAALSNVEVFKARVSAIEARAGLERNKIMVFGEQVKAYATKVSAYSTSVEAYRARIQGETAKQEAYSARVNAYSVQIGATSKAVDSRIAAYRGRIDEYTARWDGYKSAVQAASTQTQAVAAYNSSAAEIYRSTVQGASSYNELLTKQWQVALDQNQRVTEIGVSAAKANGDLAISARSLAIDAAKVGAQVAAQVGAAALSTVHYSASYSESRSDGTSNSYSGSEGLSVSASTSNSSSQNYNYSL